MYIYIYIGSLGGSRPPGTPGYIYRAPKATDVLHSSTSQTSSRFEDASPTSVAFFARAAVAPVRDLVSAGCRRHRVDRCWSP